MYEQFKKRRVDKCLYVLVYEICGTIQQIYLIG
nr:MAG TPA: hypothetical protein [Caudoviricetes sp.]